ncbi:PEBP-like protein [Pholiota conissans]|uniref:PEBP-like protein n=1 Tax=Pholiota conissans TaxID=109636 RepID=A0A9P5YWV8_9AGAR|nr:PEBP-like protein [Pholiota conissans]
MFSLSFFATLALVPFVASQTALEIEGIKAHFSQSAIVPDLLASFNPSAFLSLNFPGVGEVKPGQLFAKEQVSPTPTVTVTPQDTSVSLTGNYTLAMVDADVVGSKLPEGQNRHWLVNGVTINGSTVSNSSAVAITSYAGPWPAAGSGPHRYVVLLYSQPSTFKAPTAFSQPNMGVTPFDFNGYVKDSGLGALVAGTYFDVEEGTATASISSTSAVVSSTLTVPVSSQTQKASTTTANNAAATETSKTTSGATGITAQWMEFTVAAAGFALTIFI